MIRLRDKELGLYGLYAQPRTYILCWSPHIPPLAAPTRDNVNDPGNTKYRYILPYPPPIPHTDGSGNQPGLPPGSQSIRLPSISHMLSSPPPPHTYHPGGLPENDPPSPDRPPSRQTFHLVPSKPTDSPQPAPDITELDLTKKAFIFPLGTRYSERSSEKKTFSTTIPKTADFYTPMKSDSYATIPKHYGGAIVLLLQGAVTRISRDPIMSVPAGSRIIDMKEQKAIEEWCKMIYDKKVLENRARIRLERRLTHSCRCFKINLWRAKGEKFILVEVEPDQSRTR